MCLGDCFMHYAERSIGPLNLETLEIFLIYLMSSFLKFNVFILLYCFFLYYDDFG